MRIYGDEGSGNCLKVKYVADYLGLTYAWEVIDVLKGETRTPEYLTRNPMAQIPVVEFDDGTYLAQSNAILRYLAHDSALLPADRFLNAKVDEWLFWEQYSHEPYIAVCRFHMRYLGKTAEQREPMRVERGEQALTMMESHLGSQPWLVAESFSIADISLLAYTRLAREGGFELSSRPNVMSWIARCESELGLAPAD